MAASPVAEPQGRREGSARGGPAPELCQSWPPSERLGVDLCQSWCWEHQSLHVPRAEDAELGGQVKLRSAWWGHPVREGLRRDVTASVAELLGAGEASGVEVPATTAAWGDPARFMLKQLAVEYEFAWLSEQELAAFEHLQVRANSKAMDQLAEVEGLLSRVRAWGEQVPWSSCSATGAASVCGDAAAGWGDISPRWKRLGFQSSNPRTDLRTGILALDSLVYLVERYPQPAQRMVVEAASDEYDYPFAVASINVTQMLAKYLRLLTGLTQAQQREEAMIHDRRQLRAFAQLCVCAARMGWDAFGELYCAAMVRMHQTWKEMKTQRPELNVFSFAEVLEDVAAAVQEFFGTARLDSAEETSPRGSPSSTTSPCQLGRAGTTWRTPPRCRHPRRPHGLEVRVLRQAAAQSAYSMLSGLVEPPTPPSAPSAAEGAQGKTRRDHRHAGKDVKADSLAWTLGHSGGWKRAPGFGDDQAPRRADEPPRSLRASAATLPRRVLARVLAADLTCTRLPPKRRAPSCSGAAAQVVVKNPTYTQLPPER
ncbi:unnamed protein product [Prorocentrum cordatum]|uniref:ELMO domain-containing protein n=1 Tax=Prorocentrum cordatum TaxID=2364126 RepID=A0ABN9QQJ0_9DINO|nr:unnamed protein product [Polarella glacialis]